MPGIKGMLKCQECSGLRGNAKDLFWHYVIEHGYSREAAYHEVGYAIEGATEDLDVVRTASQREQGAANVDEGIYRTADFVGKYLGKHPATLSADYKPTREDAEALAKGIMGKAKSKLNPKNWFRRAA